MMRIIQSTIEKLLYVLVLLMFISIIIIAAVAYDDGQQIKQIINNHTQQIMFQEKETDQIKANQLINSTALKDYIACLIAINPNGDIQVQETTCFKNAPEVK